MQFSHLCIIEGSLKWFHLVVLEWLLNISVGSGMLLLLITQSGLWGRLHSFGNQINTDLTLCQCLSNTCHVTGSGNSSPPDIDNPTTAGTDSLLAESSLF